MMVLLFAMAVVALVAAVSTLVVAARDGYRRLPTLSRRH